MLVAAPPPPGADVKLAPPTLFRMDRRKLRRVAASEVVVPVLVERRIGPRTVSSAEGEAEI